MRTIESHLLVGLTTLALVVSLSTPAQSAEVDEKSYRPAVSHQPTANDPEDDFDPRPRSSQGVTATAGAELQDRQGVAEPKAALPSLPTAAQLREEHLRSARRLDTEKPPTFSVPSTEDLPFSRRRWKIRWNFTLQEVPGSNHRH